MRYVALAPLKFTNKELKSGDIFTPKNEESIKTLLAEGKVRPVSNFMGDKYKELTAWLHEFDLTGDEIKETLPGLYQNIQEAIERLDSAFLNEDLIAFQDALNRVKELYTEALNRTGGNR